jgi:hypothetical protein
VIPFIDDNINNTFCEQVQGARGSVPSMNLHVHEILAYVSYITSAPDPATNNMIGFSLSFVAAIIWPLAVAAADGAKDGAEWRF